MSLSKFSSPRGMWVPVRVEVDIVNEKAFGAIKTVAQVVFSPGSIETFSSAYCECQCVTLSIRTVQKLHSKLCARAFCSSRNNVLKF